MIIRDANEAHDTILKDAARIANADTRLPPEVLTQTKTPFHDANWRSSDNYLTISYIYGVLEVIEDPGRKEQVAETMRQIAVDAVQKALIANQDLFVGLILGLGRKGENYFERFEERD